MADDELSKELKEELERARSKVRRYLSYGAGAIFAILVLWGSMWMADRSIMMVALNTCVAIIFYWFGQRSIKPPTFGG
ncbi:unnamed protein product [marine sediment metagenome]|uniref:Uncharacterized protein n=1 Tax=marine sediment metagenome TaxID=412755 RepID=X1U7K7_9ZZZZ